MTRRVPAPSVNLRYVVPPAARVSSRFSTSRVSPVASWVTTRSPERLCPSTPSVRPVPVTSATAAEEVNRTTTWSVPMAMVRSTVAPYPL